MPLTFAYGISMDEVRAQMGEPKDGDHELMIYPWQAFGQSCDLVYSFRDGKLRGVQLPWHERKDQAEQTYAKLKQILRFFGVRLRKKIKNLA